MLLFSGTGTVPWGILYGKRRGVLITVGMSESYMANLE